MRLVAGGTLLVGGFLALLGQPPLTFALCQGFLMGLGVLLVLGLWTPITGSLVALEALWEVFSMGSSWRGIMLATLGAALALIGPGAWSLDAWFFGWKRLEIRARKNGTPPP